MAINSKWHRVWKILSICIASFALMGLSGKVLAGALTYKGQNLTAMGLYKGYGLPTGSGFYDSGILTTPVPAGIPPNLLVFHFDMSFQDANQLNGPSGNKVPGSHQLRLETISPRFQYFYPWQPSNPHIRFMSDLIMPIVTTWAGSGNGQGVGDGGLADIIWAPLVAIWSHNGSVIKQSDDFGLYGSFPTGNYHANGRALYLGKNKFTGYAELQSRIVFKPLNDLEWHSEFVYSHSSPNSNFEVANNPSLTQALTGHDQTSYRTGDFFDASIALAYPLIQSPHATLLIGPRFTGEWQLTNDQLAGSPIKGSKQRTMTVGPTMTLEMGHLKIYGHYDHNISARNNYTTSMAKFGIIYTFGGGQLKKAFSHLNL